MNYQISRIDDSYLRRSTSRTSSFVSCRRPIRRELSINNYYFNDNNSKNSLSIEHSYNPLGNNDSTRSYSSIITTTGPNQAKTTEIEIVDNDEHRKFNFKAKFESNPTNYIEIPIQINRKPTIKFDETHEKTIVDGKSGELVRRTLYEYSYDSTKSTSIITPKVVTLQMPLYITETNY